VKNDGQTVIRRCIYAASKTSVSYQKVPLPYGTNFVSASSIKQSAVAQTY